MKKKKVRNIGIPGIKPPAEMCSDINCPFHGKIGIRGRIFEGKVLSTKSNKSAIVTWDRSIFVPKYERLEKRRTKMSVHLPPCLNPKKGDIVKIGECRPISKTKRSVVIEVGGKK